MNEINKKPTVTIGIPAYNEEANIGHLLKDILEQKREGFVLEKIIVASDGSTDSTVLISEENKNLPMQIFDNKERKGVAVRMNQIIGKCFSDVLIILNADILIPDQKFISRIIQPIAEKKADLVSCKVEALESRSFFGRVLKANFDFKEIFFGEYHQGKNIFTCHGVARAFSKNFYSHFRFTESVGEDAYSYLYCLWQGFSYVYVSDTSVLIKLSENFADHKKQSLRFSDSKSLFHGKFGENFIQKQYRLPIGLLFKKLPGYFFKNPVLAGVFLLQNCYLKF
ncbi:MAG: glycosyltransferase family 2 protein, partial [Patescibacteria group bacterium]|nr:glycosyltransferase family 2 protein [Patescibacteria group bacterium]